MCVVPIFSIIEKWLTTGTLTDLFGELFIAESSHLKKEDLAEDFNATFWTEKFYIKHGMTPKIFAQKNIAQKILLSGKYLHAMRECNEHLKKPLAPIGLIYRTKDASG